MKQGWMSKEDKEYLRDMKREMMKEVRTSIDPAYKRNMCKCGHRLAQHYMGNRSMPCGKCSCGWCECEMAETLRRDKARKGVQDMSPHPEFRGGRG
jgi:hypothetical protein